MALKDTVVGYTDESGVQLPPLHPRCRCAIDYREVEEPKPQAKPLTSPQSTGNVGRELTGTGALSEIGFKPKEHTQWSEEIQRANEGGKGAGYNTNCQRCVIAHEVRMRGYDVVARPSLKINDPLKKVGNWLELFTGDKEIYKCEGSNATEIEKFIADKMVAWGKGSRAFLWFEWDIIGAVTNHVIVVHLNENGFVQYGDPQTGKIGVVRYLREIKRDSVVIMRVDNLQFTDKVKWCCADRK